MRIKIIKTLPDMENNGELLPSWLIGKEFEVVSEQTDGVWIVWNNKRVWVMNDEFEHVKQLKTYSIGEIIHLFKSNSVAYSVTGNTKGTIIFCNTFNNNRLTTIFSNGGVSDGMSISIDEDMSEEEGKIWVFINELDKEDNRDIIESLEKTYIKFMTKMINDVLPLSYEGQLDVLENISKTSITKLIEDHKNNRG